MLDIACGTGYGTRMLAEAGARSVTGADASEDAIASAEATNRHPAVTYTRASGTQMPWPDGTFDLVVSFETIEHIDDADQFVAELRRVAQPQALVLISTPNARHTGYVHGRPAENPFHVREYQPSELAALLGRHFRDVALLGQRPRAELRPCPYWERIPLRERGVVDASRVARWKLANSLEQTPAAVVARWVHPRPLMPGEHDFEFTEAAVARGHVLLAICRP